MHACAKQKKTLLLTSNRAYRTSWWVGNFQALNLMEMAESLWHHLLPFFKNPFQQYNL